MEELYTFKDNYTGITFELPYNEWRQRMRDIDDFMYHKRPFVTVREFLNKMGIEEKDMIDTDGNPINEDLCYTNMYFWSPVLRRHGKGWQQRVDNGKLVMTFVATPVNWDDIDLNGDMII